MALRPSNPSPFWSPDLAKNRSMQDYLTMADTATGRDYPVEPRPKYDYAAKANDYLSQAANVGYNNAINSLQTPAAPAPGGGVGAGGNPRLAAVLRALRGQESGGNYGAVNSSSGALGAYQVMPSNLAGSGGWDMEALNRNITSQQFLQSRQLQNAIARYKFGNYMRQYGVKGALASWYSGSPNWQNDSPQNGGPSIHDYVMAVLARMR